MLMLAPAARVLCPAVCLQAQRVKAQREAEEVAGVTFHPEISRHAQTIWGPHEVGSVPVWQRLSKGEPLWVQVMAGGGKRGEDRMQPVPPSTGNTWAHEGKSMAAWWSCAPCWEGQVSCPAW